MILDPALESFNLISYSSRSTVKQPKRQTPPPSSKFLKRRTVFKKADANCWESNISHPMNSLATISSQAFSDVWGFHTVLIFIIAKVCYL
jgi:hypothetical protein